MRNDRDYQNSNYNDFHRGRERNDRYRNYRPYESGNDTGSYERERDYNGSTNYDHDAARRSRGLRNDRDYHNSNRERDYLGGTNFNSSYNREQDFNRADRDFGSPNQSINRDEYRRARDFSRSNGGDFDRGRMYGSYKHESRNRGFYDDIREHERGYNTDRSSDSYSRNNSYNTDRRDYKRDYDYDRNRDFEPDRAYGRDQYDDRQRGYHPNDHYDRDQNFGRPEPQSIKDKYSSSSLHYSGITSIGRGDQRNRDRYEGSRYIGRQNSDRNFAGSGIGSSQRYRY